jgi:hypothetical protein
MEEKTYEVRIAIETIPEEMDAEYKEGRRVLDVGMNDEEIKEMWDNWEGGFNKDGTKDPEGWRIWKKNFGHRYVHKGDLITALRLAINSWEYHLGSVAGHTGVIQIQSIYSVNEILEDGTEKPVDWLGELVNDDLRPFRPTITG